MSQINFRNLHYQVDIPKKGKQMILHGVSGEMKQGRLFALLGPSGSGKTTLMDLLAQRKTVGEFSGDVCYNGKIVSDRKAWNKMCGYVLQHDRLQETATVYETLMFASQLRNPPGMTRAEHEDKINEILGQLGLEHRKDARIGSEANRSLSGGELKRVCCAQELVADVKVLFLDEPTSGLDSTTARNLLITLKEIAQTKIVAATVHQPSSMITSLFDDIMILSKGHVFYGGKWDDVVPHFANLGEPCPQYMNPTDFLLDLASDSANTHLCRNNFEMLQDSPVLDKSGNSGPLSGAEKVAKTSFWHQYKLLCLREFRKWIRDSLILQSEVIQYVFTGLFCGVLYTGLPDTVAAGSFDRISCLFFVLTSLCFIPSFTVITSSAKAFPLAKREANAGMYSPAASFFSNMSITWPFEIFLTLLFSLCAYFFIGLAGTFGQFMTFFVTTTLFLLLSETLGLLAAMATSDPTVATIVLSLLLLICLALGGFLVSETKPWTEWFSHINFFTYGFTALVRNEFDGLTLVDETGESVDALEFIKATGRLPNDLSVWANVAVLFAFTIFFRLLAFFFMLRKLSPGRSKLRVVDDLAKASSMAKAHDTDIKQDVSRAEIV